MGPNLRAQVESRYDAGLTALQIQKAMVGPVDFDSASYLEDPSVMVPGIVPECCAGLW